MVNIMIVKALSFIEAMLITLKLVFNKKLNWGYVRFWSFILSLLLFSAHSSAFEGPVHKLNFHLNGADFGLSDISFNSNAPADRETTGFGISYDYVNDYVNDYGEAFAIEWHASPAVSNGEKIGGELFFIGYRIHGGIHGGINVGWGVGTLSQDRAESTCKNSSGNNVDCSISYSSTGLGMTLGYGYVFTSGFTLGFSILYVLGLGANTIIKENSPLKEKLTSSGDPTIGLGSNVSLILGYTWY